MIPTDDATIAPMARVLATLSSLPAIAAIASAVYLHRRGAPLARNGEIDCGFRPLTAWEAAVSGDRIVAWDWSAFGVSLSKQIAFLFHDDETRSGNAIVLLPIAVPLWLPVARAVPLPVAWLVARRRERVQSTRLARGECAACGYDRRAAAEGRCPECGTTSGTSLNA